jgi:hypothetical protein
MQIDTHYKLNKLTGPVLPGIKVGLSIALVNIGILQKYPPSLNRKSDERNNNEISKNGRLDI